MIRSNYLAVATPLTRTRELVEINLLSHSRIVREIENDYWRGFIIEVHADDRGTSVGSIARNQADRLADAHFGVVRKPFESKHDAQAHLTQSYDLG